MESPLTKHQWLGLGVLCAIIALFIGSIAIVDHLQSEPPATTVEIDSATMAMVSILEENSAKTYYTKAKQDTVALLLHQFDPNTADSIELLQLGFRPWMAKNVLKYRSKGGVYRSKEALRKIYGMTDELYEQIEPYIVICLPQDTLAAMPTAYRVKKDTTIDLNNCDTTDLMLLRGIGSYYARKIIRYRNELGGYVSAEQIREIREIPKETADSVIAHFIVNTDSVKQIDVNHASVERLARHPYLSFTQARAIYELRRTRFKLESLEQLAEIECISDSERVRIEPYLRAE